MFRNAQESFSDWYLNVYESGRNEDIDNLVPAYGRYNPETCYSADKIIADENGFMIGGKSKYKGLYMCENTRYKNCHAHIKTNAQSIYIGYFVDEISAAKAYNQYVIDHELPHLLNIIEEA
jgi:hypothetical protein